VCRKLDINDSTTKATLNANEGLYDRNLRAYNIRDITAQRSRSIEFCFGHAVRPAEWLAHSEDQLELPALCVRLSPAPGEAVCQHQTVRSVPAKTSFTRLAHSSGIIEA